MNLLLGELAAQCSMIEKSMNRRRIAILLGIHYATTAIGQKTRCTRMRIYEYSNISRGIGYSLAPDRLQVLQEFSRSKRL